MKFKKGDRIVCVKESLSESESLIAEYVESDKFIGEGFVISGKIYVVKNLRWLYIDEAVEVVEFRIIDEGGKDKWYPEDWFKLLKEVRKKKLLKLKKLNEEGYF